MNSSTKSHSGFLIAVEGIDGSGKSLLIKNLYENLIKIKKTILTTKEPTGTHVGEKLYKEFINNSFNLTPKTEFLLFAASRSEHFNKIVIPHLEKNYIVISDRMSDSSLIYQGYTQDLDLDLLKTVNSWVMNNIKPDLTIYLQIDLKTALTRIKKRSKNLEIFEKKQTFLEKSITGFNNLYKNQKNVLILNGIEEPETILNKALLHILNHKYFHENK